jgi:hypothetical protein
VGTERREVVESLCILRQNVYIVWYGKVFSGDGNLSTENTPFSGNLLEQETGLVTFFETD